MIGGTRKRAAVLAAACAAALALGACQAGGASSSSTVNGGTVTLALPAGTTPDFIFPLVDGAHYSVANIEQFQRLMWRPLYMYGANGKPVVNEAISLAEAPVFTPDLRQVTITLKPYVWSDGQPVTSRDFTFLFNLLQANKLNWAAYLPGDIPDNVTSVQVKSASTFTLVLDHAYSPTWFEANQLSQLMPIPQHAWDKTSAGGAVGDNDTTPAGAKAVYDYLLSEAKQPSSYATNPLWQVVDGPWKLADFRTDGYAAFVPNPKYAGPVKPKLDKFIEQPFTTEQAELNVLRSNGVDYGYLPQSDVSQAKAFEGQGYTFSPWISWGINYSPFNFANPTAGPVFKQLYFRQAMQRLIDEDGFVSNLFKGYGWPTNGPVPIKPDNPYVSTYVKSEPYKYSQSEAAALLKANGWTIHPDGVSECTGSCGPGVPAGAKLQFSLVYASGDTIVNQEVQAWKSAASQVGIQLDLSEAPFNQVIAAAAPCKAGQPCTWQIVYWGGGWLYGVNPLPVGDQQFLCGAGANFGTYCDNTNDANIHGVQNQPGIQPMTQFEDYLAKQLPVLWMPYRPYQLSMIKKTLHGVDQSPILSLTPEDWSLSK
jgi:peptide/nickel transport system substrate-binding protein